MIARAATLSLLVLLAGPADLRAQQSELERVLDRLAAAWSHGDAAGLALLGARAGVALDLDGESFGPLPPRQAAAVLRRLLEGRETLELRRGMARIVGGTPLRAFGELDWVVRVHGTTIPERATIFLAFVREEEGWRLTQIRLLQ